MKNLAISKNDICLIAGSGFLASEVANYLNYKRLLSQIIIINENKYIKKNFKNKCKIFKIHDIEKIILFLRSKNIKNILIIGYVELPPLNKINLSIKSKLLISKDIFLKNINDQSIILKKYLASNKLNLLSQKKILKKLLISDNDEYYDNKNKNIINQLKSIKKFLKKIFSLNIAQSLVLNGNRVISDSSEA